MSEAPDPRTRTVIVVLPPGQRADWLKVTAILSFVGLPACLPVPAFAVRRRGLHTWFTRWTSRHLVDAVRRHGRITHAAGGRVCRLDLTGTATNDRHQACARWRTWDQYIARTTPPALPWDEFLARERRTAKGAVDVSKTRSRFEAQHRVLAMLAYNSYPAAPYRWDLDELAALQAGEAVYVALHWQRGIIGDALVTPDGRLLQPASDSLADQLRYLVDATQVIHSLAPGQHVIAVRAAPMP